MDEDHNIGQECRTGEALVPGPAKDVQPDSIPLMSGQHPDLSPGKPWGFLATMIFYVIIMGTFIMIQTFLCVGFALVKTLLSGTDAGTGIDIEPALRQMESNGVLISTATTLCGMICTAMVLVLILLRKNISVKEYLCLRWPGWREIFKWCLALLIFVVCQDSISLYLGKPIVADFWIKAYNTCIFPPILFLAIVVPAPIFEEVFFRGFVFAGIRNSRLGLAGAVIITSLLWAVIHMQYDIYGMVQIFLGGLLLSWALASSGSIYPCIVMHSLMNVIAFTELVIKVKFFS